MDELDVRRQDVAGFDSVAVSPVAARVPMAGRTCASWREARRLKIRRHMRHTSDAGRAPRKATADLASVGRMPPTVASVAGRAPADVLTRCRNASTS